MNTYLKFFMNHAVNILGLFLCESYIDGENILHSTVHILF